jgi:hypothetical protein
MLGPPFKYKSNCIKLLLYTSRNIVFTIGFTKAKSRSATSMYFPRKNGHESVCFFGESTMCVSYLLFCVSEAVGSKSFISSKIVGRS